MTLDIQPQDFDGADAELPDRAICRPGERSRKYERVAETAQDGKLRADTLYLFLRRHRNNRSTSETHLRCNWSIEGIGRRLRSSPRTIERYMAELVAVGLISRQRVPNEATITTVHDIPWWSTSDGPGIVERLLDLRSTPPARRMIYAVLLKRVWVKGATYLRPSDVRWLARLSPRTSSRAVVAALDLGLIEAEPGVYRLTEIDGDTPFLPAAKSGGTGPAKSGGTKSAKSGGNYKQTSLKTNLTEAKPQITATAELRAVRSKKAVRSTTQHVKRADPPAVEPAPWPYRVLSQGTINRLQELDPLNILAPKNFTLWALRELDLELATYERPDVALAGLMARIDGANRAEGFAEGAIWSWRWFFVGISEHVQQHAAAEAGAPMPEYIPQHRTIDQIRQDLQRAMEQAHIAAARQTLREHESLTPYPRRDGKKPTESGAHHAN